MKYSFIFYAIVFALMLFGVVIYNYKGGENVPIIKSPSLVAVPKEVSNDKSKVILPLAYISEAPEGIWKQPWANACEETTILMVDKYYAGEKSIGVSEAKSYLLNLFAKEESIFGTSRNANAKQILEIISRYTNFKGRIVTNPTLAEIKAEIDAGHPMISLHRGFDLQNPNIEFSPTLSSYHTIVIVGYDNAKRVFITHDPGDEKDGANHEYGYNLLMNSLHDYNYTDNLADGLPTVIFTQH